jgi:hypothetical protein
MRGIEIGDNATFIFILVIIAGVTILPTKCSHESPEVIHKQEMALKNWCVLNLRQQKTAKDTLTFLSSRITGSEGYKLGYDCQPYMLPDSVTH